MDLVRGGVQRLKKIKRKIYQTKSEFKFINPLLVDNVSNFEESPFRPVSLDWAWTQAYPDVTELAKLSENVYTISDLPENTTLPFKIPSMDGWECIGTGVHTDGYCGGVYLNKSLSHIVIAHAGTDSTKDVIADLNGIVLNKNDSQISTAFIFTKIIVNEFRDTQFTISITGHSLGGWLAQICTFYIEYPDYITKNPGEKKKFEEKEKVLTKDKVFTNLYVPYHLHAVVFDSPGCRSALLRIIGKRYNNHETTDKINSLDITVIIAPSNIVNTCGEHVGHVIHLPIHGVRNVSWLASSHSIAYMVTHLSSMNPEVVELDDAHRWKPVQVRTKIILKHWYIGHENHCRANIFSTQEQEFLHCAQVLIDWEKHRYSSSMNKLEHDFLSNSDHQDALSILNKLKINHLIHMLKISHNIIEFHQDLVHREEYGIPKFIWHLKRLFRRNRLWATDNVLRNLIRVIPTCVQSICQNTGFEYLDRVPKLCPFTTSVPKSMLTLLTSFLLDGVKRVLRIDGVGGVDKRWTRVCMAHIVHSLTNGQFNVEMERTLFLNTFYLK